MNCRRSWVRLQLAVHSSVVWHEDVDVDFDIDVDVVVVVLVVDVGKREGGHGKARKALSKNAVSSHALGTDRHQSTTTTTTCTHLHSALCTHALRSLDYSIAQVHARQDGRRKEVLREWRRRRRRRCR
jgi:hypothetical protein